MSEVGIAHIVAERKAAPGFHWPNYYSEPIIMKGEKMSEKPVIIDMSKGWNHKAFEKLIQVLPCDDAEKEKLRQANMSMAIVEAIFQGIID